MTVVVNDFSAGLLGVGCLFLSTMLGAAFTIPASMYIARHHDGLPDFFQQFVPALSLIFCIHFASSIGFMLILLGMLGDGVKIIP